jgi:NTP pyrophosphatase (non-canonical NTP hydrolase)
MPREPEPRLSLRELQARLRKDLRGLHHPPLGACAALTEEVGEVAKILLDHHGYGKPLDKAALGSELADVLVCLCEIATLHGIELDAAATRKASDLATRARKWRRDLGTALARSWKRPAGPGARRPD